MKGKIGIFLVGVTTAFLLDPKSGSERRTRVGGWLAPVGRRVANLKDRVVSRGGDAPSREADAPGLLHTLEHVAKRVQGQIDDASEIVGAAPTSTQPAAPQAHTAPTEQPGQQQAADQQPTGTTIDDVTAQGTPRPQTVTPEMVAPTSQFDPIPEGDPDEHRPFETINDPTLVARVESELYRDETIPKGKLNIDAVHGVVTFRGTVDEETADQILERTLAIDGVHEVVDLLQRG